MKSLTEQCAERKVTRGKYDNYRDELRRKQILRKLVEKQRLLCEWATQRANEIRG